MPLHPEAGVQELGILPLNRALEAALADIDIFFLDWKASMNCQLLMPKPLPAEQFLCHPKRRMADRAIEKIQTQKVRLPPSAMYCHGNLTLKNIQCRRDKVPTDTKSRVHCSATDLLSYIVKHYMTSVS